MQSKNPSNVFISVVRKKYTEAIYFIKDGNKHKSTFRTVNVKRNVIIINDSK